jgi:hypothetical protein
MIVRFDYRNKAATIMSFTGNKWIVPLGYHRWTRNNKAYFFDFGTLLMNRKVNPSTLMEDATAARELVASWEDFEEKPTLLSVIDEYIRKRNEDMSVIFEAALREAYGIVDGSLISRAVASGKLVAHKDVITHRKVVDLINYLMDCMPGLAMITFPSPKSAVGAARSAQRHNFKVVKLNEMTKGMDSFQIFTAFRVASFLEKAADRRVAAKLHRHRFVPRIGDICGVTLPGHN